MSEDYRYQAALDAARQMLDVIAEPAGPSMARRLSQFTFIVLEAIYASERRALPAPAGLTTIVS